MGVLTLIANSLYLAATAPLWVASSARVKRQLLRTEPRGALPIRRVRDVDLAEVIQHDEPVIIESFLQRFELFSLLQPDVMKRAFGHVELPVFVNRFDERGFEQDNKLERIRYDRFIDEVFGGGPRNGRRYYTRWAAPSAIARRELQSIRTRRPFDHCNLWVGDKGNITTIHCDVWHGFLGMNTGRKLVTVFPPNQIFALYPTSLWSRDYNSLRQTRLPDDFHSVDDEQFPNVRRSLRYEETIGPGDLLYIPPQWWHQVISLDSAVSVAFRYLPSIAEYARPASMLLPWRALLNELGISKERDLPGELGDPWNMSTDPEAQGERYINALRSARDWLAAQT